MLLLFPWSCFLAGLKVVDIFDSDKWGSWLLFRPRLAEPHGPAWQPPSPGPSRTHDCAVTRLWPLQPCGPASTSLAVALHPESMLLPGWLLGALPWWRSL